MSAELRHIDFHGQQVPVLIQGDGEMFVPMRPRVEALGLDWSGQAAKFRSNPRKWGVEMISTPTVGGIQDVLCLPLRKLDVWLLNLEPSRVKPEFREELEREQDELSQVLWAYRLTGAVIRPEVRAAAPSATRALFDEIEAMTGLDPESAQPQAGRFTLPPLVPKVKDWQRNIESARYQLLDYIDEIQQQHGWHLDQIIDALPVLADQNPDLKAIMRQANARAGDGRLVARRTIYRWRQEWKDAKRESPVAAVGAPSKALPPPTGDLLREMRSLFGDDQAKACLQRMYPTYFGGAR